MKRIPSNPQPERARPAREHPCRRRRKETLTSFSASTPLAQKKAESPHVVSYNYSSPRVVCLLGNLLLLALYLCTSALLAPARAATPPAPPGAPPVPAPLPPTRAPTTLARYPLDPIWQQARQHLGVATTAANPNAPPAAMKRQNYLPYLQANATYFRRFQEPDGRILDEFQFREVQNATACYALVAAALVISGQDTNFLTSAVLALDYTLQRMVKLDEKSPGADLSIAPAMIAYEWLHPLVAPERRQQWQTHLRAIAPDKAYRDRLTDARTRVTSYNVGALTGEYLRQYNGVGAPAFLYQHLPVQLRNFTVDGMYRDTFAPVAYDGMSRHFLAQLVWHEYAGPGKDTLLELLDRGALTALLAQSPLGEVPTGGRGSQHQWNEAQQAFVFELWATRKKAAGDTLAAQAFKRGAQLSWQSILRWVRPSGELNIVKNAFDPAAQHGFEKYSSHSHFNLLTASMLALAWRVADDSIFATVAPAEVGGFVFELAEFRKIIANAGGLYVEIDTKADTNYHSTGFVRLHKTGVEGVIGPSDSLPSRLTPLAVGIGWSDGDTWKSLAGENFDFVKIPKLTVQKTAPTNVAFTVRYPVGSTNVAAVLEHYDLTPQRVQVTTTVEGTARELRLRFPALVFTGVRATTVRLTNSIATVTLGKSRQTCRIVEPAAAVWRRTGDILAARNGFVEPLESDLGTNRVVYTLTPEVLP